MVEGREKEEGRSSSREGGNNEEGTSSGYKGRKRVREAPFCKYER